MPALDAVAGTLSGGNQQKLIVGREMSGEPVDGVGGHEHHLPGVHRLDQGIDGPAVDRTGTRTKANQTSHGCITVPARRSGYWRTGPGVGR